MINLENITKKYGEKIILNDFNAIIDKELVCITGTSGCGKTTLLNIIGCIIKPDSGNVKINEYQNPDFHQLLKLRRETFGYVLQNVGLFEEESVLKNLLISKPYSKLCNYTEIHRTLEKVNMNDDYLNKTVNSLSAGEKQRIMLARILLKPCSILLLDEPTSNLDLDNRENVISLIGKLKKQGITIVCATHDDKILSICDKEINMEKSI